MRGLIVILASLVLQLSTVTAQPKSDDEQKLLECRRAHEGLIGLSRDQLRERCGFWADNSVTTTASGTFEQIIYGYFFQGGPYLYVYLRNGVVTAVRGK